MALDKHDDEILTSLHGRKAGIDRGGYLVGSEGMRQPIETLTANSTMADHGVTVISSTAAGSFTLARPPYIGVTKTVINATTFAHTVTRSTANGACSLYFSTGSEQEGVKATLSVVGAAMNLIGITTAQWALMATPGSTAYLNVATSS